MQAFTSLSFGVQYTFSFVSFFICGLLVTLTPAGQLHPQLYSPINFWEGSGQVNSVFAHASGSLATYCTAGNLTFSTLPHAVINAKNNAVKIIFFILTLVFSFFNNLFFKTYIALIYFFS